MPDIDELLAGLTSGDDERAQAAVDALPGVGAHTALVGLQNLLHAPDVDSRWWAVRALAEIEGPQSGALLVAALQDPDPAVRQCAALGVRKQQEQFHWSDPQAIPALIAALSAGDHLLRGLASAALAAIGAPAVDPLLEVLPPQNLASPVA